MVIPPPLHLRISPLTLPQPEMQEQGLYPRVCPRGSRHRRFLMVAAGHRSRPWAAVLITHTGDGAHNGVSAREVGRGG